MLTRLRSSAATEPGKLRIIGVLLVALVLLFGALTAWQITQRADAARDVVRSSEPLSADASDIYRYLADADATAASGFLASGEEPKATRDRYDKDIDKVAALLAKAAANPSGSGTGQSQISKLNRQLPKYTGYVESARANNRQGLPLGGAYLRFASDQMRSQLLPAAQKLYEAETARLSNDYGDAKTYPWAAIALGVVALIGLGWSQRRLFLRTNRVFNAGLVGTTAATTVVLLWLVVGHSIARSDLNGSYEHGASSLQILIDARVDMLKARGDENMTLVARGSGTEYQTTYKQEMTDLHGTPGQPQASDDHTLLDKALALADDEAGRAPLRRAMSHLRAWQKLHQQVRASDDGGDYDTAVAQAIGGKGASGTTVEQNTGEEFDLVDTDLSQAVAHEQQEFFDAANDGRGAFTGIAIGAAALAVIAATCVVLGLGRRLGEYR